jgi:hypothetical protein
MVFDFENGKLNIANVVISNDFTIEEMWGEFQPFKIREDIKNGEYESFVIKVVDVYTFTTFLSIVFHDGKIQTCSIGISCEETKPFEINEIHRTKLLNLFDATRFGAYDWGSMNYAEDRKGGNQSICISYKIKVIP